MSLLLVRREDDELAQAQSDAVGVTPEGINGCVPYEMVRVGGCFGFILGFGFVVRVFGARQRASFEQSDKLPGIFVFLLCQRDCAGVR